MTENNPPDTQDNNINNNTNNSKNPNDQNEQNEQNDSNDPNNDNNENNNEENNNNNNEEEENKKKKNKTNINIININDMINSNKDISPFIIRLSQKENNKKLDEIILDLIRFKEENNKNFWLEKGFKQTLYSNLEKRLIELSMVTNDNIRKGKIISLNLWYEDKKAAFEALRKISRKTYKEPNVVDELDVYLQKEEEKRKEIEEYNYRHRKDPIKEENLYEHRNKDVLYKNMLEEYKRKLINIKKNIFSLNEAEKKMNRTRSTSGLDFFSEKGNTSTFYSTKFGKTFFSLKKKLMKSSSASDLERVYGGSPEHSFFATYKKNKIFLPKVNKETKFSYSFNRPPYDFSTMYVENKVIESKLKNAAEKRTQEEMFEKLNRFGYEKSKFNENVVNKYELKDVIKMYTNTNNLTSDLLEKYKIKKEEEKKEVKKTYKSKQSTISVTLTKKKKEKNKHIKKSMKRSQSCAYVNYNYIGEKQKMEMDDIKNIDFNTKVIIEKNPEEIKTIKMKLKQPKEKIKSKILKYHFINKNEKLPNDAVSNLFYRSDLFKQQLLGDRMCNLFHKKEGSSLFYKDSEEENSEDEYRNFYMSAYDFGNIRKIEKFKKIEELNKTTRNKNSESILNSTFILNKNNFLNLRKTMSSWRKNDYEKLVNKITKNIDITRSNRISNVNTNSNNNVLIFNKDKNNINIKQKKKSSLLKAMINPNEECYPQFFLPRTGTLLLRRIGGDLTIKKAKNKRKK